MILFKFCLFKICAKRKFSFCSYLGVGGRFFRPPATLASAHCNSHRITHLIMHGAALYIPSLKVLSKGDLDAVAVSVPLGPNHLNVIKIEKKGWKSLRHAIT